MRVTLSDSAASWGFDDLMASNVALPTKAATSPWPPTGLGTKRKPPAAGPRQWRGRRPLLYLQTVMKGKGEVKDTDAALRHFVQFSEICLSETRLTYEKTPMEVVRWFYR